MYVVLCLQNVPKHFLSLSKTATLSRQHKRSLVPQENILSRNWSLLVRHIFHCGCPSLPTCDISCCRYDCQATCHSYFKLSALAHRVNRLFCCCLAFSVPLSLLLSVWGCGFLLCPFLILLILFLLSFWFFCLVSLKLLLLLLRNEGCTFSFHCWFSTTLEKAQGSCHLLFLAFVVPAANNRRRHLGSHIMSAIISLPKWEGSSLVYPQCTLPFKGLWIIIDGILKRAGWIMHFWFSSQTETLWVGNEKEIFGWMWKWFIWYKRKCSVAIIV